MSVEEILGMTAEEFLELKNTIRVDAMLVENDRNPPVERPMPLPCVTQLSWDEAWRCYRQLLDEQARLEDLW